MDQRPDENVAHLVSFIRGSERGFTRADRQAGVDEESSDMNG
jgi:hypothetical protein